MYSNIACCGARLLSDDATALCLQADALALGKTAAECEAEGVPAELVPHKSFPGDRVSMQLLLPELSPKTLGHLLGIYEHRTAVQGALWYEAAADFRRSTTAA